MHTTSVAKKQTHVTPLPPHLHLRRHHQHRPHRVLVQAVRDAVRLLVTFGHTLAEVAEQSEVLDAMSADAINRLVTDRKERGERLPELEEIIRDIS